MERGKNSCPMDKWNGARPVDTATSTDAIVHG